MRPLTDRPQERFGRLDRVRALGARGDRREDVPHRLVPLRGRGGAASGWTGSTRRRRPARFQGRLLAVERDEALPLPEGQFYPWQMEGARGRDARRAARRPVRPGQSSGAQDLWVVEDDEHRQRLIPAVPSIVVEVSVADRRIVIDPPEGLLEL